MELARGRTAGTSDLDLAGSALRLRPHQVDVQEAVVEPGVLHLDTFGQHEGALELACGDTAMQVDALALVLLLATHDKLVVLHEDVEVIERKSRYGQGEAQRLLAGLLDIVRRITIALRLGDAIEHALEMVEAQEQG